MKVKQPGKVDDVIDVICDVCGISTRHAEGAPQFATMHGAWGKGSSHCGEEYELHLCESCFFAQLSGMKRARWLSVMFEQEGDVILQNDAYGLVGKPDP